MKTLFVTMATVLAGVSTFAQGMLNFSNYGPGLQARVLNCGDSTPLAGPLWVADLYWAPGIVIDTSVLVPLNAPAPFSTNTARAGYFFGGSREIPSMPGGSTITAQVCVWNSAAGTNYLDAQSSGGVTFSSWLFQVTLAVPPEVPTTMTGLTIHPDLLGNIFPSFVPTRLPDGTFQLTIACECPFKATVLGSTNLTSWDPIKSINIGTDGFADETITQITDYAATNFPQRFYALRFPQSSDYTPLYVVGYVNTSIVGTSSGAFQMIANPLHADNNTIGALIHDPPDFTTLFKWTGTEFVIATYFAGAWDHPEFTLNPGEGAITQSASPWTNTFVGEVLQGSLSNPYLSGLSIRASDFPLAGTLTQLQLPATQFKDRDVIYQFNTVNQSYDIYTLLGGSWLGGPLSEPTLAVGEAVWLQPQTAGSWNQTYTVR